MAYRNQWIAAKVEVIRQDIVDIENGDAFLVQGIRKTTGKAAELRFQKRRVDLLEEVDAMTKASLQKKIKSMRDKLSDDAQMILNRGPYDDLNRKEFEAVCYVEMLMAAHQFHPMKKGK